MIQATDTSATPAGHRAESLDDLLGAKTLAALLGKHRLTIINWKDRGCPYVRIPGDTREAVRFRLAEVVEWALANGKEIPPKYRAGRGAPGSSRVRPTSTSAD